jgi:hypothetical protein
MSECLCFQNGASRYHCKTCPDRAVGLWNCRYHDRQAHRTVLLTGWARCRVLAWVGSFSVGMNGTGPERTRVLTFRHRAYCILGQAFRCSPENAFYIFNQQIYFIT